MADYAQLKSSAVRLWSRKGVGLIRGCTQKYSHNVYAAVGRITGGLMIGVVHSIIEYIDHFCPPIYYDVVRPHLNQATLRNLLWRLFVMLSIGQITSNKKHSFVANPIYGIL